VVGQVRVNLVAFCDGPLGPQLGGAAEAAVEVRGRVAEQDVRFAQRLVAEVLARHRIADGARVRLVGSFCEGGPTLVQVNLRVCGAPARVQVAGPSSGLAITRAAGRLDRQIRRLTTAYEPWPWPDPERRALGVPGAGAVRRHKAYRLHAVSPCQAIAFMNAMDYDVLLYTDDQTGEDAVVYRSGPTGVRLARQHSMHPPATPTSVPLTVNAHRIATLTPAGATSRLVRGWLPFVFFTDRDTGRGNLVYRRYDGELGRITPEVTGQ
jgi:hypothetical protein